MRIKKIASVSFVTALILQLFIPMLSSDVQAADSIGRDYYISSLNGDNKNDATTEGTAWETLDKLEEVVLQPGDHVYLESGSVFNGYIHLREVNGTEEDPIIITSYGEGKMPLINGNGEGIWYQDYVQAMDNPGHVNKGYVSSTILFYDSNYIEMSNLEITNESDDWDYMSSKNDKGKNRMSRTGVAGVSQNTGAMTHIYLDNLDIHDIDGNVELKHMNNGGIQFNVSKPDDESKTGIARYHDIKFTNNKISRVNRSGISFGYTYKHQEFVGGEISDETVAKYGHTDIVFEGNYVLEPGNDAIVIMYADRPEIRYNVAEKPGIILKEEFPDYWMSYSAGIWPWKTKNAIFEYNEVFDTNGIGNGDGQAWDIDYSDGTIYQYNYSHNNGGGAVLFCLGESVNGEFRYNLSHNDLTQLITLQGNPMAKIYNNVFYIDGDLSTRVHHHQSQKTGGDAYIANNIFYNTSTNNPNDEWIRGSNQTFTNNLYYGYDSTPENDKDAIIEDPMFKNAKKVPTKAQTTAYEQSAFNGFMVEKDSPVINAGIYIPNNAKNDFFGNPVGLKPDIGIHEVDANEDINDIFVDDYIKTDGKISFIPYGTTVEDLKANIRKSTGTELTVFDSNGKELANEDEILKNTKLIVTFKDDSTKEYVLELKKEYKTYEIKNATAGNEHPGEDANLAIDGDINTIWHTAWEGTAQDNVWISLDLGEVKPVEMLQYVPRQTGGMNGVFTKYSIFVKEKQSDSWTKVDTYENEWSASTETKFAYFDPVNARYVKLQADDSVSAIEGLIFGSAAEVLLGAEDTEGRN